MENLSTNVSIVLSAKDQASAIFGGISDKLKGMGLVGDDAAKKIEGLGNSTDSTSSKLKTGIGIAAAAVTAGVVAIGVESIKSAGSFQTMTATLVTTAGESQKNIAMVRDGMLKLSTETGTSADQMSKAMYTIESAGFHAGSGLTILKAAAQGAKTENADLQKVADAVTSSMVDYHLPAEQAANVTSKLVAAVGAGKANFEDFTGALHSVLPIASAAHVSLNDILGDLASMTVHGMSADQASQNLAQAIRKMQTPTAAMRDYLAGLGINAADLSDKLGKEGLSGTLEDISKAIMTKMGPSGKVLIDSFNQSKSAADDANRMISSMPKSLQSLANQYKDGKISVEDWRDTIKGLPVAQANLLTQYTALENKSKGFNQQLKSGSPAAKTYSQALQTATGDATTFNVALMLTGENAAYTANAVKTVGKAHAEAGNNVEGWAYIQKNFNQQQQEAQQAFKNTSIAIGSALLPIATQLMGVITKIVTPVAEWVEKHKTLATTILGSVAIFGTLVASILLIASSIGKIQAAWTLLSSSFLTNPITLIIIGIGIAALLIITHWDTVRSWFQRFWKDLKQWADDVINPMKAAWLTVKEVLLQVWDGIKIAAKTALDWIQDKVNTVTGYFEKHKKGLTDIAAVISIFVLPAFMKMAIQAAIAGAKAVASAAVTSAAMVVSAAKTSAAWVVSAARTSAAWVTQTLPGMLLGFTRAGASGSASAAKAGGSFVIQAARTTAAWAVSFARFTVGMITMTVQFLIQAARMAAGWLMAMGPIGLVVAVAIAATVLIINHWATVSKFLVKVWWDIEAVWKGVANFFSSIFKSAVDAVKSVWNGIPGFFSAIWQTLKNGMGVVRDIVMSPFKAAFNGISDLWNDTVGKLSFKAPSWVPGIGGKGFDMPKLPHIFTGTSNFGGGAALVGEQGPELVLMPQGSQVLSNPQTQRALQSGGSMSQSGTQQHITINVNVGAYAGQPGEIDKLGTVLWQSFQRIARQHGQASALPNIGIRPT